MQNSILSESSRQEPVIFVCVFVGYIVGIFFLSIRAYTKTHKRADFLLANRELGAWAAALSAGASDMSGWLLLGLPGLAYIAHVEAAWLALGTIINWKYIAAPLQQACATRYPALTLPEYFANRYPAGGGALSLFSALLILIFYVFYISAGFVAAAKLFVAIFPLSYLAALQIGASVVIIYTLIGGFRAVVSTDCVQAAMMVCALLVVCFILATAPGAQLEIGLRHSSASDASLKPVAILSALAWGLGYPGQPHILARFMAMRDKQKIQGGMWIATTWTTICLLCAVGIGLFAANHEVLGNIDGDPEQIFITAIQLFFHPLVAAALSAAILAAIMSTADSQLLIAATAIFHDLGKAKTVQFETNTWLVGIRLTIIAVASLGFVLAVNPQNSVLALVSYAWAGFGATLGPAVIVSLFAPNIDGISVLLGMLTGAIVIIFMELRLIHLPGVYSLIPALFANFFVTFLHSKLSNKTLTP